LHAHRENAGIFLNGGTNGNFLHSGNESIGKIVSIAIPQIEYP
jgi:hypothetical protein